MLSSQILEVAIGLVFIYLLFSLICSMINEWFARVLLKLRASTLADGIYSMINDPAILYNFYRHPLINALANQPPPQKEDPANINRLDAVKQRLNLRKQPSYIPGRTFALALFDLLAPTQNAAPQTVANIRAAVNKQSEWLKGALLPLLDAAQNDLAAAQKNVEKWFDDTMDRVSGWYKRKTRWIMIGLALLVCIVMNVDTFAISNSLYRDSGLRETVVAAAQETAKKPIANNTDPQKGLEEAVKQVRRLNLPIGWVIRTSESEGCRPVPADWALLYELEKKPSSGESPTTNGNLWSFKILGWLFSIMAVSMGAPFWFDLLNKLTNLRGAGKPPEKIPEPQQ